MIKVRDTCISGDFEGWDGDKIYELDDGSEWELSSYTYSYHYCYRPKATLWKDGGRYYLEVKGMRNKVEVRRA